MQALHRVLQGFWCSLLLGVVLSAPGHAASLGVSPTLIDLAAGESTSGLRVQNSDAVQPVSVQARILRWQQTPEGEDVYSAADAVVASPPVARIQPGAENLIRIVRIDKTPPQGEESYRLLIDELPDPAQQRAGAVSILIRHSVPVFFSQAGTTPAQVQWRIEPAGQDTGRGWRVTAENIGDKRIRLSDMRLTDAHGTQIAERQGLVGYVLGHSTVRFFLATSASGKAPLPTALRLAAQSELGLIETDVLPVMTP